ncbi:HAD hydrolase-like protein [Candidatus Bathyarchaeota archaeon]|nr:HAD hydrolase-like protein [Candidatus Bathyarchaeota archaeon]
MCGIMVIKFDKVKLVIFDFDGVLFNGLEAIKLGVKNALEKYDLSANFDEAVDDIAHLIQKLMPIPIPKIILKSYNLLNEVSFLSDIKSFFKRLQVGLSVYRQYLKEVEHMTVYDGVPEMLDVLSGKGIKFAIFTSGTKKSVMNKLEKAGLLHHFPEELIIGAGEVPPGHVKPSPDGIEMIYNIMGLDSSAVQNGEIIMVGDMKTDIIAGKTAFNSKGIGTVGIKSGYDANLPSAKPDLLLENTTQLLSHFA